MERDCSVASEYSFMNHFNSHAHVERDSYLSLAYDNIDISTHTLTWSVTTYNYYNVNTGADFNSHAHVERDIRFNNDIMII